MSDGLIVTPLRALSAQTERSFRKTFAPLGFGVSSLYGASGLSTGDEDALRTREIIIATPEKLDFYADHKLIRSIDTPSQIPTHPQKLYFSLWGTDTLSSWMGPFTDPGQPIAMQVDWAGYTPTGAHCLFPQSITCP